MMFSKLSDCIFFFLIHFTLVIFSTTLEDMFDFRNSNNGEIFREKEITSKE